MTANPDIIDDVRAIVARRISQQPVNDPGLAALVR